MSVLTPEQLAGPGTEHAHQTAFFCAISAPQLYMTTLPQHYWHTLLRVYAIPSGGARDVVTAGRLKAEGVRPGVPDTHLPVARYRYHSLYLEFKKPDRQRVSGGGLSSSQIERKAWLEEDGNYVGVAYGWQHGLALLTWYLTLPAYGN